MSNRKAQQPPNANKPLPFKTCTLTSSSSEEETSSYTSESNEESERSIQPDVQDLKTGSPKSRNSLVRSGTQK